MKQISKLKSDQRNFEMLPHSSTIYNALLRPEAYRDGIVPNIKTLCDESRTLLFAGTDTTSLVLMHGSFYILKLPNVYQKLKEELRAIWPDLHAEVPPSLNELEKLPFLVRITHRHFRLETGFSWHHQLT
jgi:cytochrome P450